jgi:hypothetical protein
MTQVRVLIRLASVPTYFAFKIAAAILLLKVCANYLTVSGYGEFAQLVQFGTVLNLLAVAAVQNGLIRQSAAAGGDEEELAGIHGAALIIWTAAALLLLAPMCLASKMISSVLVGNPDAWSTVIVITILSLTSGPGQIWCSILSGRKRVTTSLVAQASGLLAGVGVAIVFVVKGDPYAAATAFAGGPLLTLLVAGGAIARLRLKVASPSAALFAPARPADRRLRRPVFGRSRDRADHRCGADLERGRCPDFVPVYRRRAPAADDRRGRRALREYSDRTAGRALGISFFGRCLRRRHGRDGQGVHLLGVPVQDDRLSSRGNPDRDGRRAGQRLPGVAQLLRRDRGRRMRQPGRIPGGRGKARHQVTAAQPRA